MSTHNGPLVTVITLTKDSSRFIEPCIQSLLKAVDKCEEGAIRHLVVDGQSTDDTVSRIEALSPDSKIISLPPEGLYNAINHAVEHEVETPFVTYLHSDDELDTDYFLHMMSKIKGNEDSESVIVGTVSFIDEDGNEFYKRRPPFFFHHVQKLNNLIFHPNAIYPTPLERRFPYLQAKYGRVSDYYHILEIMKFAKHIRVPKAVYKFRLSNESWTVNEGQRESKQKSLYSRMYIHMFETKRLKRLIMKIQGRSYWNM